MSNRNTAKPDWRLVGEFARPDQSHDDQWLDLGLTSALEGIHLPSSDLERVKYAAVAAAKRAGSYRTALGCRGQPLVVRVLIFSTIDAGIAARGWGYFVLERDTAEIDSAHATLDQKEGRPTGHCIELYLYPDAGSA